MPANKKAAKTGGGIAHRARLELESKTGRKVVTGENSSAPLQIEKEPQGLREECANSASSRQAVLRNARLSKAGPGHPTRASIVRLLP